MQLRLFYTVPDSRTCFPAYWAPLVTALVFIGAAITDAVDGYLARKVGPSTFRGHAADALRCAHAARGQSMRL